MAKSREIPWVIEEQTKVKHQLLNDYVQVWMLIIFRQQAKLSLKQKVVYIDGFAGPGIYWADSTRTSSVPGSPIIVAQKANECIAHDKSRRVYILGIDSERVCAESLQNILKEKNIYQQNWEVVYDTFEVTMEKIFSHLNKTGQNIAPAFIFIDPFGYSGFSMETLSRILRYPRTELFINLMVYDICRFLMEDHAQGHLRTLFGTDEYKKGESLTEDARASFIMDLYCRQLKAVAKAEFIQPFRINTPGQGTRPRFFLIHASQNIKALKEMKHAMRKSSTQPFRFEAIGLDPCIQLDLFKPTGEEQLREKIYSCISNHTKDVISYEEIENLGYQITDGIDQDIKKALICLEKTKGLKIHRKTRQRKNTVTVGALIEKPKK